MNAEIIAVGTEILLGQILNSNAKYLSEKLADLGVDVFFHTSVGDNKNRLTEAIKIASNRSDLVILTGGLGPTGDDLTKEAVADFLKKPLEIVPEEVERLKAHLAQRRIAWMEAHSKQAAFIPGSSVLSNDYGSAPGMAFKYKKNGYILLPGPPREMEPMFLNHAIPWITRNMLDSGSLKLYSLILKISGLTESKVENLLEDLIVNQTTPTLATYVGLGEVQLRITARAADEESFAGIINPVLNEVRKRIGKYIVAENEKGLVDTIAQILKDRQLRVSAAESCTSGLFSASLTAIPGASVYFAGSIVAYSNEIKEKLLGIPGKLLQEHGAVSEQTAAAMALSVRKLTGSDIGIGITGIAGPDGGTAEKPVGTVYIALNAPDRQMAEVYYYKGKREFIRAISVKAAQLLLYKYLKEI